MKLVPSLVSTDGSARVLPPEFTIVIRTALEPNEPIDPIDPDTVA